MSKRLPAGTQPTTRTDSGAPTPPEPEKPFRPKATVAHRPRARFQHKISFGKRH